MNTVSTKGLTGRYVFALGLVALLSIAACLTLNKIIMSQKTAAAQINVSGSLRWLSQRATACSIGLINKHSKGKRERYRKELLSLSNRMEKAYDGLMNGSRGMDLPGNPSPEVSAICFEAPIFLDAQIRSFLAEISALVHNEDSKLTSGNPHLQYILAVSASKFLKSLDTLVEQYQSECEKSNTRLQRVETGVMGFTLCVLLMEALFIFRPMIRRMKRDTRRVVESEGRIRPIVDSAWDGIITVRGQGIIELFNPAAETIFGYTSAEVSGKKSIRAIMPGFYHTHFPNYIHSKEEKSIGSGRYETIGQRKDFTAFPMELSFSEAQLDDQRLLVIIVRDITVRKRMEERLGTLSRAVEQSPATVVITDREGNIEYVNPKFTQLTGYTPEEAIGKNPRILKSGQTSPEEYKRLWDTVTSGGEWRGEFHNRKKDGELYWESASISPVKNREGVITHFIAVKEDVTELKQAMERLTESEKRFRLLIESSKDGILAYDKDFRYTLWNSAMEQVSGILREVALGKIAFQLFPFLDRVGEGECFRDAVKGKAAARSSMPYNVPQTGRYGYFDSSHFPLFDTKGMILGGMAIIRDVTKRVEAERLQNVQHAVVRVLAEATATDDAFSKFLQVICEALMWDLGGVWLLDRQSGKLRCIKIWHVPLLEVAEFKAITLQSSFPPGIGLPGRVWENGKPGWIADVAAETSCPRATVADKEGLHGTLTFPIMCDSEVLGVIEFFSHEIKQPDGGLLNMMGAIGGQIGLFIRRKQAEEQVRKLSYAIEQSSCSIVITDTKGSIEYVNPRFTQLTDYRAEEVIGKNPRVLKSGMQPPEFYKSLWNDISSGKEWRGEFHNRKKNGESYWEYASIAPIRNTKGNITHFIAVKEDITERKHLHTRLEFLADHDPLTNLFNRRRFQEELGKCFAYARRYGSHGALFFLDVDHFKQINDTLGHFEGDRLLVKIADLLKKRLRNTDILARLGGDEFAVFLPNTGLQDAQSIAGQIIESVRREVVTLDKHAVNVTVSVGITIFPEHGDTTTALLTCADIAMYQAKEAGRNRACIYAQEHKTKIEVRLSWEERIRDALVHDRFVLHLQPVLDLRRNCIVGYEALLRMIGADGKLISPQDFLNIAERSGLIHDIDHWVVRRAIRFMAEQKMTDNDQHLAVNLSGKSVTDQELVSLIKKELTARSVNPENLVLEITETAIVANMIEAQQFITALKSIGCRFALDDFGRGFSSFDYLKHLPVDYLKIDGGFIRNLSQDTIDQHLVRAMASMAHGLGKMAIAEFVSDEESVQLLKEYGVDYAQGYYIGAPREKIEMVQTG